MMKKRFALLVLVSLAAAAVFCAIMHYDLLFALDGSAADALYQHTSAADGEIVVIGMDQRGTDALGPMPWDRSVFGEVIDFLNYADPEARPAVIGIDVLFIGDSADPDAVYI